MLYSAFITQTVMPLLKLKSREMLTLHHPKFQLHLRQSQRSLSQDKHIQLKQRTLKAVHVGRGENLLSSCKSQKPLCQDKEEDERAHSRVLGRKAALGHCLGPAADRQSLQD